MGNATSARKARADASVQRALSDIEAAEQQLAALSHELQATIEHIARRVEGAAAKLETSPDKRHPSWRAANERVDTLMLRLARWGRSAGATTH